MHPIHPGHASPAHGHGHHYGYGHHTGYDYGAHTGTNGLVVGSPVWPSPHTSGETMDKLKAWLDKPTMASYPSVKNKHVAIVVGVSAVAGLAWYGSKHRWF